LIGYVVHSNSTCCPLTLRPIRILQDISQLTARRSSRKGVVRFLAHKVDANEVTDYREKLKQVMSNFSVRSPVCHSRVKKCNSVSQWRR
jgi:hypothetical protein